MIDLARLVVCDISGLIVLTGSNSVIHSLHVRSQLPTINPNLTDSIRTDIRHSNDHKAPKSAINAWKVTSDGV